MGVPEPWGHGGFHKLTPSYQEVGSQVPNIFEKNWQACWKMWKPCASRGICFLEKSMWHVWGVVSSSRRLALILLIVYFNVLVTCECPVFLGGNQTSTLQKKAQTPIKTGLIGFQARYDICWWILVINVFWFGDEILLKDLINGMLDGRYYIHLDCLWNK